MKIFKNNKLIPIFLLIAVAFIIGIYLYSIREIQPTIVDTTPANGSINVLESSQININFSKTIQEKAKKDISITISPDTQFNSTWTENTFVIGPKNNLQNNTKYSVTVFFKKSAIYNFSFETSTFSQEEVQKYGGLQAQSDYEFGQVLNAFIKKNPWYTSLPIKNTDYIVSYDSSQKKFSIAFLNTNLSASDKKSLTQQALGELKKIGAPNPIQYYIYQP